MKKLDNTGIKKQLENLPDSMEDPDKPAVYEGESFRSGYSRAKKQWQNYTTKSGQNNSFMYHHTNTNHNGIIGPNKGSLDYKFQVTDTFRSNLSRQSNDRQLYKHFRQIT